MKKMKYLSHITTWTGFILIKQLNSLVLDKDEVVTVSEEDDSNEDENKSKVKSAKAITDLMLGLMDFKIGKFRWKNDKKKILYDIANIIKDIINSLDNTFMITKRSSRNIFNTIKTTVYKYRGFE